jgi:dinuclear metal center YbgI/SA1388 family protein
MNFEAYMKLAYLIEALETLAPLALQESYDNSGLIVGNSHMEVNKALLCLDSTEEVVDEAIAKGCDLIIAHHPIVFNGIKRFNGTDYVQKAIIKAISNGIAIYACHTNLDNVLKHGVNAKIAEKLGLVNTNILSPRNGALMKLGVYVPVGHSEDLRNALFHAGAGEIGQYDACSFSWQGTGTFRAGIGSSPFLGQPGVRHKEIEDKIEVVFPSHLKNQVVNAMKLAHPYEEVAYDLFSLDNEWENAGSGLIGELPNGLNADDFLEHLKTKMNLKCIRFTKPSVSMIQKVAVCGGAGSFLIKKALQQKADALITSDVKYHEYFDSEQTLMVCDIGHNESECFTPEIFAEILSEKFPNFATVFAETLTNPVNYYF